MWLNTRKRNYKHTYRVLCSNPEAFVRKHLNKNPQFTSILALIDSHVSFKTANLGCLHRYGINENLEIVTNTQKNSHISLINKTNIHSTSCGNL